LQIAQFPRLGSQIFSKSFATGCKKNNFVLILRERAENLLLWRITPKRFWEEAMKSLVKKTAFAALLATTSVFAVTAVHAEGEKYVLVSHAPDSDSWWNTIKNGIALAGKQMDVTVEYRNPPTGDIADMARLIEQTAASNPNGIITTLADFDVLKGPIQAAVAQGINVIIMNTGTPEQAREVGALMYVGQPEYDAGLAAGMRAKGDGVGSFLCVNHAIQQPTVGERCRGFADGLGIELGNSMMDSGTDPAEIKNKVMAYLSANPDTGAILTLGPVSADPTIAAVKEMGIAGDIYFGTFDLGTEIVSAIKDGTIKWGIDQQPFLQAYLPVVILTNYDRYGVLPGNNINSGPGFVTKDALTKVEEFAGEYR
jgi:simple sugar transport system substrate-binding protein